METNIDEAIKQRIEDREAEPVKNPIQGLPFDQQTGERPSILGLPEENFKSDCYAISQ